MTKSLSYKMKLATLLLGLCLTHVLCQTEANESTESTTTTALSHTTSLPQPEITATKAEPGPDNVHDVTVSGQTEDSITLEWSPVGNITTYRIQYFESGNTNTIKDEEVTGTGGMTPIHHVVSPLTSGTTYNFILFTVSGNVNSTGYNFTAATVPEDVLDVKVLEQNETSISLEWSTVNNITTYRIQYFESGNTNTIKDEEVDGTAEMTPIHHVVSPLTSGTTYSFTLFTVSGNLNSTGYNFTAATEPENVHNVTVLRQNETSITLKWSRVKDILTYQIQYNDGDVNNTENITGIEGQTSFEQVVSPLTSGTVYNFTLLTLFSYTTSTGHPFTAVTAPSNAEDFEAVEQNETSITLQWSKVNNISKYVLKFNGSETTVTAPGGSESVKHLVSSLMNGTKYDFTLLTVFENVNSSGANIIAATAPSMVDDFKAVGQNETSITLQWSKVHISDYVLYFNGSQTNITAEDASELVTYNVSSLDAMNQYEFTLFTVLNNVSSTGKNLSAVTAPLNVRVVSTKRFLTGVTLQWNKTHEKNTYILDINGSSVRIPIDDQSSNVTYTVEPLKPGTEYPYTLYTVFHKVNSSGFEDVTVTVINCTESPWSFTNSAIEAKVEGVFSFGNATNGSRTTHYSKGGDTVSFTDLYPGSTYKVYLWYTKEGLSEPLLQCEHNLTIIPPDIQVHCVQGAAAYAIHLNWDVPAGVWTQVEVNVTGKNTVGQNGELTATIGGLQPAKTYKVSAVFEVKSTESGFLRSEVAETTCATYGGGVIAGSVLAVLLFCLVICLAVFIWLRKPFRKESYMDSFKPSSAKYNDIPVEKFPDYFYEMSRDEDRAFIEEYEGFQPVGTEQTHKTAEFPENKPKNRFTNASFYRQLYEDL